MFRLQYVKSLNLKPCQIFAADETYEMSSFVFLEIKEICKVFVCCNHVLRFDH